VPLAPRRRRGLDDGGELSHRRTTAGLKYGGRT
jgi:hypothetical protein